MRSWLTAAGARSPRGAQMWAAYSSFSDRATRQAFLRTLRSVVDYRGQTVSALNRLHVRSEVPTLVIWGDCDQIIPVEHAHEAHAVRAGSRLAVLPGIGHFPQVEAPTEVAHVIEEFLEESINPAESTDHMTVIHARQPENGQVDPLHC